jgi:hypothetical protein
MESFCEERETWSGWYGMSQEHRGSSEWRKLEGQVPGTLPDHANIRSKRERERETSMYIYICGPTVAWLRHITEQILQERCSLVVTYLLDLRTEGIIYIKEESSTRQIRNDTGNETSALIHETKKSKTKIHLVVLNKVK